MKAVLGMLNRIFADDTDFICHRVDFPFPIKLKTCCCASLCSKTVERVKKVVICWGKIKNKN